MDSTGTFDVYKVLSPQQIITAFHKHYELKDYQAFSIDQLDPNYYMISTGISDQDFIKLVEIMDAVNCNWICIDVANGYQAKLVSFCQKIRNTWPDKIIIAGNVASRGNY